ncbi:MAG: hypothetical protein QNJ78_14055 [Gammaproteobacteria bacterium]|nr:hypothetical protein [Gammaproteobacteria bacterium]
MKSSNHHEHCMGCVYYPPNLPVQAYAEDDYRMLLAKPCSFDFQPGDRDCDQTRKTSCALVDLKSFPTNLE